MERERFAGVGVAHVSISHPDSSKGRRQASGGCGVALVSRSHPVLASSVEEDVGRDSRTRCSSRKDL